MTREEKINLAAELLELPVEYMKQCCGEIAEIPAMYFSVPEKGGGSLIIDDEGGILYADSSVGYKRHLEAYMKGVRTPID